VNAADKAKADEAIADLRKALEEGDVQSIKDKTEALKQVSYKIAEELYKTQSPQGGPAGGAETGETAGAETAGGGNDTKSAEDADYEVVDEGKDK
jgi:molecular chaperone DnaK